MESGGHASGRPADRRDLASNLEMLDGLLNTLTDVLDIREVFDRVSQVVQGVLPHDVMGVTEISERGDRITLRVGEFLRTHAKPAKIVLVGMSMGGYFAPRAAAFEERIDGVVAFDTCFDFNEPASRIVVAAKNPICHEEPRCFMGLSQRPLDHGNEEC
jgi:pimeloyl-ACP methyl ester carboxylesterase